MEEELRHIVRTSSLRYKTNKQTKRYSGLKETQATAMATATRDDSFKGHDHIRSFFHRSRHNYAEDQAEKRKHITV